MLIDTENPSSFPSTMQDIIYDYLVEHLSSVEAKIKGTSLEYDSDVRCAIEDYLRPIKAEPLYRQLRGIMDRNNIVCYHATKVLNCKQIIEDGLRVNEWNRYSVSIRKTLNELNAADVDRAIECIHKEYERKYELNGVEPQICFFSGLHLADGGEFIGYDQFCENIGGELARWALRDAMPKTYQLLKNNGKQLIVKFFLPFLDIANYQQDMVLYQFVCYYAAKYFWGWDYTVQYDGSTYKNIAPNQILELIQYSTGAPPSGSSVMSKDSTVLPGIRIIIRSLRPRSRVSIFSRRVTLRHLTTPPFCGSLDTLIFSLCLMAFILSGRLLFLLLPKYSQEKG